MQEAAKLVADSALGVSFRTIFLNGKAYSVHPPTLKIICRAISHWSMMDFEAEDQTNFMVISQIPQSYKHILKGIAVLTVGDVKYWKLKAWLLYTSWVRGRIDPFELKAAKDEIMEITLAAAKPFFDCATSLQNVVGMVAKAK